VIERVIYEVRIVKNIDNWSSTDSSFVTLIEYIEADNIVVAEIIAVKLAKDVKGLLKAVAAKPYEMKYFGVDYAKDEHEPDEESIDEFSPDKKAEKRIVEKK